MELTDEETWQEMFGLPGHVIDALLARDQLCLDHLDWERSTENGLAQSGGAGPGCRGGRVAARHIGKHLREDVMIGYLADGLLVSEYY